MLLWLTEFLAKDVRVERSLLLQCFRVMAREMLPDDEAPAKVSDGVPADFYFPEGGAARDAERGAEGGTAGGAEGGTAGGSEGRTAGDAKGGAAERPAE